MRLGGSEAREVRVHPQLPERPVVGDVVALAGPPGDPVIAEVLPRGTVLLRAAGRDGAPRAIVANADLLLVVAAVAQPPLRRRLIDRYLVAGHHGGLEPALVLTKVDLPHDRAEVAAVVARYRAIGYPVLMGSAKGPVLAAQVADLIAGRVGVLAGHSGVGKSTLTRGLTGVDRQVGAVSDVGRGRHTTTDPRLIPLVPGPGAVVDTAGVRSFFLPRMDPLDLAAGFPEIAAAARDCRFRGCRHAGDSGCAVAGAVSPDRLESYHRLLETWPS